VHHRFDLDFLCALFKHMARVEEEEARMNPPKDRPFVCACGKGFPTRDGLRKHEHDSVRCPARPKEMAKEDSVSWRHREKKAKEERRKNRRHRKAS
jgi:hypothetical protein